jgi:hypothetical protein
MKREDFDRRVLAYGSDLRRWPQRARRSAHEAIGRDATVSEIYQRALREDALMREALQVETQGAALTGRILASVEARAAASGWHHPLVKWWIGLASVGAAAMFALGVFAGNFDTGLVDLVSGNNSLVVLIDGTGELQELL